MQTRSFFLGGVLGSLLGFTGFGLPNGSALAEDAPCQTTPARDLAPEQAASLEQKLEHDPHDMASRTRLLRYYCGSYRFSDTANRHDKAREYAQALLTHDIADWNSRDHHHHGHLVLGSIALAEDDIEEATKRLLAAGESMASSEPNAVEPNMSLAGELLKTGEKEVVLEYFSLCFRSWESGRDKLGKWSVLVQAGLEPDFGGNLHH